MSSNLIRRSWAVVAVTGLVLATVLVTAGIGRAATGFAFKRYAGSDRFDTAARVAADTFGTSDIVVITSGTTYPDALSATFAAGLGGVPILLVQRDSIPSATAAELTALGATKALIVGGTGAVSDATEAALKTKGLTTTRLAGATRYETSKKVAESGGASAVGKTGATPSPAGPLGGNATAIVVSGETFPDALSAGPMAFAGKFPVLLTTSDQLSPDAKAALTDLTIKAVLIVGGTAAVSQAVQDSITAMSITVTRLAGSDRTETASKVADYELANLGFVKTEVDLAPGQAFADALAGATHAGKKKAAALLTVDADNIGTPTKTWLGAHGDTLTSGHIDGGTGAVSSAAEADATAAGTTLSSTSTTSTTGLLGSTTTTTSSTTTTTTPGSSTTTTTAAACPTGKTGVPPFCF